MSARPWGRGGLGAFPLQRLADCGDQPTFRVRVSTGEEITALPEEVLAEYEWSSNPNNADVAA